MNEKVKRVMEYIHGIAYREPKETSISNFLSVLNTR